MSELDSHWVHYISIEVGPLLPKRGVLGMMPTLTWIGRTF